MTASPFRRRAAWVAVPIVVVIAMLGWIFLFGPARTVSLDGVSMSAPVGWTLHSQTDGRPELWAESSDHSASVSVAPVHTDFGQGLSIGTPCTSPFRFRGQGVVCGGEWWFTHNGTQWHVKASGSDAGIQAVLDSISG